MKSRSDRIFWPFLWGCLFGYLVLFCAGVAGWWSLLFVVVWLWITLLFWGGTQRDRRPSGLKRYMGKKQ